MRARARIDSVWMVAGHAREAARFGALRQFARFPRVGEQSPKRAIGRVDRVDDEAVKSGSAIASEDAVKTVKQPRGPSSPLR